MFHGFRWSLVFAIGISLIAAPVVYAHGGGGGHGGGGHMGGGHMGGGHMGGGHMGGGHMGGGHMGSSHMGHSGGFQHQSGFSGQQHYGGQQQFGGQQHFNAQQHVIQSNTQHMGNVQHMGNQNFSNQHLGNQNQLGTQHNFGTQHNATFYQNHALHNGTGSNLNNATLGHNFNHSFSGNNLTNHQSSQFLSQHALHSGSALQHNAGSLNHSFANLNSHQSNLNLHQSNLNSHQSSNFLSNHHISNVSSVSAAHHGAFLSGQGGLNHQHLGLNNNLHNFNSFNHNGGYYRNHGFGYGGFPYYGYGYGLGGFGFGLGLGYGLGYGLGFGGLGYGLGYYGGYGLGYYGGYYGGYGGGYYGGYGGYGGYGFNNYCYGLNGYGYGLNGYGYGLNYGYPNWGCLGYMSSCAYQPMGYGYLNSLPGYGQYGNYAGYPGYTAYGGLGTSGLAYGPSSQMLALGPATAADAAPPVDATSGAASGLPTADEFARIGETAFKTRDYKGAVRAWRHALVDDPQNAVLVMMLSQALFATEQFSESAGAIQASMQTLPQEKWDVVIKNFRDLYGKGEDYTTQVRALEKAAREKPDEPSLRFLLGYHYGFLGYPAEAVRQLQKCVTLAPRDEMAQKVLRLFEDKLPKKEGLPPAPGQSPDGSLQTLPTPIDFVPPPPLNPEPSSAGLKTAGSDPANAVKPGNATP